MAHNTGNNQPTPSGGEAFIDEECCYLHELLVRQVELWGVDDEFGRPREVRYVLPRDMVAARVLPDVAHCNIAAGFNIVYPPEGEGTTPIVKIFTVELGPEAIGADDAAYCRMAEASLAGSALWAWYWREAEIGKDESGNWWRSSRIVNKTAEHAAINGLNAQHPFVEQTFTGFSSAYKDLPIRQEFETFRDILRRVSALG